MVSALNIRIGWVFGPAVEPGTIGALCDCEWGYKSQDLFRFDMVLEDHERQHEEDGEPMRRMLAGREDVFFT